MSNKKRMSGVDNFAHWLLVIGGLNWGLTLFDFNLVEALSFGQGWITTIVYALVRLAGVVAVWTWFKKLV